MKYYVVGLLEDKRLVYTENIITISENRNNAKVFRTLAEAKEDFKTWRDVGGNYQLCAIPINKIDDAVCLFKTMQEVIDTNAAIDAVLKIPEVVRCTY